jgi:hypothetical protein
LYYTNFNLQFSTNLALSNSWATALGSPTVNASQFQETNGPISGQHFFRLHRIETQVRLHRRLKKAFAGLVVAA